MTGSTIDSYLNQTVTIGSGGYLSPLTITSDAFINPNAYGDVGLFLPSMASVATITNSGVVHGGTGQNIDASGNQETYGGSGGDAVLLSSKATFTNAYIIQGGSGGDGAIAGGGGGSGVVALAAAMIVNTGSIYGGLSGVGSNSTNPGGAGGIGVYLATGAKLMNSGRVQAGYGEYNGSGGITDYVGDTGGIGVATGKAATIVNTGTILGGAGGAAYYGGTGGAGLALGAAAKLTNSNLIEGGSGSGRGGLGIVAQTGASFSNTAIIRGGAGTSNPILYQTKYAGGGGGGVALYGATATNTGLIAGGAGGDGLNDGANTFGARYGGNGAVGISVSDKASFTNRGSVDGGNGGKSYPDSFSYGLHGTGGAGVDITNGGHVNNAGTISGGNGGYSYSNGQFDSGGYGVNIEGGGTFTNAGTVYGGYDRFRTDAVYIGGTVAGTLISAPGAVFNGDIAAAASSHSVLELTGFSSVAFSGIEAAISDDAYGQQVAGFTTIDLAAGAVRTVEGVLAGFQTVEGFATHDTIVLDGFSAPLAATTITSTEIIWNNTADGSITLLHSLAKTYVETDAGGKTTITAPAGTAVSTIASGAEQFVLATGTATKTTVQTGGVEQIYSGGTAANTTIAGGELLLDSGAKVTGNIGFTTITGGLLQIDSATLPTNTIIGFIAGDTIALTGIAYNAKDTVTVAKAGVVTVTTPSKSYTLNIANAKLGETDFKFGAGSRLTKSAATPKAVMAMTTPMMTFLRPMITAAGPAVSVHQETDVRQIFAVAIHDPTAGRSTAASATLSAHAPLLGAADSLRTTLDRNQHITIPQHPA
jgi:hypothetical protein